MINLELAEYDLETGKFVRFLEVGNDFLFGGDIIVFHNPSSQNNYKYVDCKGLTHIDYKKDKKDPLNRFDGLFNGRTYGKGRFVLILNIGKIFQDDVLKSRWLGGDLEVASDQPIEDRYYFLPDEVIGNLHENPELYEKINK